jgi:hypothetical protein
MRYLLLLPCLLVSSPALTQSRPRPVTQVLQPTSVEPATDTARTDQPVTPGTGACVNSGAPPPPPPPPNPKKKKKETSTGGGAHPGEMNKHLCNH